MNTDRHHTCLSRTQIDMKQNTFLDIPESARRRIYLYTGICRHRHVVLRPFQSVDSAHFHGYDPDFKTTFSLLQICKAVYDEVKTLIFSENRIIAPYDNIDNALALLWNLPPHICSKLTKLCIHLHVEAPWPARSLEKHVQTLWGHRRDWADGHKTTKYRQVETPNIMRQGPSKSSSESRIVLWQAVAERLLSHSPPGTLTIDLVCHTADFQTISAILQPFDEYPGVLRDFNVNLGRHDGVEVTSRSFFPSDALKNVKLPVTYLGSPSPMQQFRYLDLPTEIQEQILANTDLVTPNREVYWHEIVGYDRRYKCWANESKLAFLSLVEDDCDFRVCTLSNCRDVDCLPCCTHRWRRHTSCLKCWRPPGSLMLVNRALYEEAIRVLWRYNRVIIYPWKPEVSHIAVNPEMYDDSITMLWRDHGVYINYYTLPPPANPLKRHREVGLQTAAFMTGHRRPHVLHHMRNFELVFGLTDFKAPEARKEQWRNAPAQFAKYANVKELTISVYLSKANCLLKWPRISEEVFVARQFTDAELMA